MSTIIKGLLRTVLTNILCFLFNIFKIPLTQKYFTCLHAFRFTENLHVFKSRKIIHKIAFFISSKTEFFHRYNIISALPKGSFVFVIPNFVDVLRFYTKKQQLKQIEDLKNLISREFSEEILDLNTTFTENIGFTLGVGQNLENYGYYYKGFRRKLLFPYLCKKGIKIDEILGAKGFMLLNTYNEDCNKYFDVIFCVGPFSKKVYQETYGKNKEILDFGSTRFENLSSYPLNTRICISRKNIVWLPTHSPVSSLPKFLRIIESLHDNYDIYLKPHPASFHEIRNLGKILEKLPNIHVIKKEINSIDLLKIADFVFCDYGGSAFTAIHNDKNVLFLNTDNINYLAKQYPFGLDTPEVLLRKEIINFDPYCTGDDILKALKDNTIWEEQKKVRKSIRERFFTITKEPASQKIANKLFEFLNQN